MMAGARMRMSDSVPVDLIFLAVFSLLHCSVFLSPLRSLRETRPSALWRHFFLAINAEPSSEVPAVPLVGGPVEQGRGELAPHSQEGRARGHKRNVGSWLHLPVDPVSRPCLRVQGWVSKLQEEGLWDAVWSVCAMPRRGWSSESSMQETVISYIDEHRGGVKALP